MKLQPKQSTIEMQEHIKTVFGEWLNGMSVLQLDERETHISFTPLDTTCSVYSDDPNVCTRILKAGYTPTNRDTSDIGMSFSLPFTPILKGIIRGRKK